jgi:hypothetical protein
VTKSNEDDTEHILDAVVRFEGALLDFEPMAKRERCVGVSGGVVCRADLKHLLSSTVTCDLPFIWRGRAWVECPFFLSDFISNGLYAVNVSCD